MLLRINALVLLLFVFCIGITESAVSKSFTIPEIRVEVIVQSDGSLRITEHRTYDFNGSYTWADYRLPFQEFSAIKDVRISEDGNPFINENSEDPGTFLVQQSDSQIRVKWFYNAEDESRTFTVSYTLEDAIVIGPEWSQFFWNYVSSEREKDTDSLFIDMTLPRPTGTDSVYSWKRGPQQKIELNNKRDGYAVTAVGIENDEFVKIRSIFPSTVFSSNIATTDSTFSLTWAQSDEASFREEQAAREAHNEKYAQYGKQLTVVVCLFSIAVFVFLYQKYGKRYTVRGVSSTETIMIPGRLKPAAAGWLLNNRHISSGLLMATLLDLAHRNYFVIKEQESEEKLFGGKKEVFTIEKSGTEPSDELTGWEASLAEFVNRQIEDSNHKIDELFTSGSTKISKWFSSWKDELKTYCESMGWFDEKSYKGVYVNIGLQIPLLALAILAALWTGPIGIIAIFTVAIFLIASAGIIRRTEKGEVAFKKWKAYREGLKNAGKHSISSDHLDKHFIYATAFGLSGEHIKTIFKQCDSDDLIFAWFIFHSATSHSPANFANTFSTLSASGTASFPGTSSVAGGAGASAGAAGGGASGGAG